jgi:uncharacterized protein
MSALPMLQDPVSWVLLIGIFFVALLYASVGHAGASGYIALMSLLSFSPASIRPLALALNILVAGIASWQFMRAGHFRWNLFWPFALLAVPMSFVGGHLVLPVHIFQVLVGVVLLASALWLLWPAPTPLSVAVAKPPPLFLALGTGAALGLLAGLTGTGGGIFLTPLLLYLRWAPAKTASAVSALFILLNSVAGLLGNFSSTQHLPVNLWMLLIAAAGGGWIGAHVGSQKFAPRTIKRLLSAVLLIASFKLILT